MFCPKCGKELTGTSDFCPNCGARLGQGVAGDVSPKSRLVATLLCVLPAYVFAISGIHRFYLGKIGTGIAMLLTLGGLGIWTLIDFIFVVSGNMKDKEGKFIKNW